MVGMTVIGTKFDIGVTIMQGESMIDIDTTDHAGDDMVDRQRGRDRAIYVIIDILSGDYGGRTYHHPSASNSISRMKNFSVLISSMMIRALIYGG